jgi:hypothetical protein
MKRLQNAFGMCTSTLHDLLRADNSTGTLTATSRWPPKKTGLFDLAVQLAPANENKIVGNWIEDHGTDIKILFLPVAHPHLNRIEHIWSS